MNKLVILLLSLTLTANIITADDSDIHSGIAVPLTKTTIKYPYRDDMPGIVLYTAQPGTILKGATYSSDGQLIKNGDVLIRYKPNRRHNILKMRKKEVLNAKAAYEFASEDLARYKKLMKGGISSDGKRQNIISRSTYELAVSNYLKTEANLEKAEIAKIRAEGWYKLTTEHAYYDCIVTAVHIPLGLCAFGDNIMSVAQMNPIGIKVKLTRDQIKNIPENIPIKVYPAKSDKYVTTYAFDRIIKDDGIILKVKNNPIIPNIPSEYSSLPKVTNIQPVKRMSASKQNAGLAVPKGYLQKDSKGSYVWTAAINKSSNLTDYKKILLLDIKKVYVKPSDEMRYLTPHLEYIRLDNPGVLTTEDYIVGSKDASKNLDNAKQVIFYRKKYVFSLGDPVKVEFDL